MATSTALRGALKTPEAATYLGYDPRTLEGWRRRGTGPKYICVGRSVRYRIRDLDAWQDEHAVETA